MVLKGPVWFVVTIIVVGLAGMGLQIATLRMTKRQKWRFCLGVVYGAFMMAIISLVKRFPPVQATLFFGDLLTGLAIGLFPMRGEMGRAAEAETQGVKHVIRKEPIYAGLAICLAIYIALFSLELGVFRTSA